MENTNKGNMPMPYKNKKTIMVRTPARLLNGLSGSWWNRKWAWLSLFPLGVLMKGCLSKSLLMILISLLLFALLVYLFRNCNRNKDPLKKDYGQFMPIDGGGTMPPVDPGKIGYGRDSITPIALDRINVLLEKKEENTADKFQMEFKKIYPEEEYRFVYYDSLTYRLQLVVPENKRQYLIDNLNLQLPQFEFLLFDESIFQTSYVPNDLGLKSHDWYFRAIKAYEAWNITRGEDSIIVAVVDNGFDVNHPEIASKIILPFNVPERSSHLFPPAGSNCPGHGTHVAATAVGAMNNSQGVCGIAPECKLIPVQVATNDGVMTLTSILDGILYAIYKGAKVVNVSLGVSVNEMVQHMPPADQLQLILTHRLNEERVWDEVFKIANNKNCTLVLAAGNENVLSGFDAMKRSNQSIIVSAVDKDFKKANFSNYGNYSDIPYCYSTISAPGVDIYNAFPNNSYESIQGTSMASPIVAGAVALMKSLKSDLTTSEIIDILQSTGINCLDAIGNIIQLDAALKAVQSGNYKKKNTGKQQFSNSPDRLKTGDIINDLSQLNGLWKSTESLESSQRDMVDLYMAFTPSGNKLILVETSNNNNCFEAPLDVKISNGNLVITQLARAVDKNEVYYQKYIFTCTTDKKGFLLCNATPEDKSVNIQFNLLKIK